MSSSGADGSGGISNAELFSKLVTIIKTEVKDLKTEIKQEIQDIKSENTKILHLLKQQNQKVTQLEDKYAKLEQHRLQLERTTRKNNILVFGLDINTSGTNLADTVVGKLNLSLGVNITVADLNNVFQIKSGKNGPIKIEFVSYLKKQLVFQNVFKLRNSKIFIVNDLCPEDRETNKILQKHRKLAKEKNILAKIVGNKLIVNGDPYTAEDLEKENQFAELEDDNQSQSAPATPSSDITQFEVLNQPTENINNILPSISGRESYSPKDKPPAKRARQETTKQAAVKQGSAKTRLQSQSRPPKL